MLHHYLDMIMVSAQRSEPLPYFLCSTFYGLWNMTRDQVIRQTLGSVHTNQTTSVDASRIVRLNFFSLNF